MQELPAGDLAAWLRAAGDALERNGPVDVPCGTCTACCRSSQFVHVEPDETAALRRIPKALLFPAPGKPKGHLLLGYDEHGACPMLVDDRCSIYEDRPRACRAYDCRVFAAAGVEPEDKPLIAARVRQWRFEGDDGRVRAAAVTIRSERPDAGATEVAVLAVRSAAR